MIFLESIKNTRLKKDRNVYPYNIPSIMNLDELKFRKSVTFFVGENGSEKSTLVEAIAINAGFNPEGGSRNFNFKTRNSHSEFFNDIRLVRDPYRNKDGYFLRAESFYNLASEIENVLNPGQIERNYGGPLHECSHGESFTALIQNRLSGNGLYVFDEPESALSINSQFNLLVRMKELTEKNSQFIIATHSPVLMAYPDADIFHVSENGFNRINYEDTEQYRLTSYFLSNPKRMLKVLGLI